MLLKEKINQDFMLAFKEKNMEKKNFLGLIKATIETQEKKLIESTDENVLKVLKIIQKNLIETIKHKQSLNISCVNDEAELSYVQEYMPKQMTGDEIHAIISSYINNGDVRNLPLLMGKFNKENKGKNFDNKVVNQVISKLI
jgi:uncharacterized protein YqeY